LFQVSSAGSIKYVPQYNFLLKPIFSFLYTDTYRILDKWDPGCHFFGHDPDSNLAALEALLASSVPLTSSNGAQQTPFQSPISALFCECPSNPLLQSSDIVRLRQLADQYGFAIIIDDTIGTFVNTDLLRYADVIVTSMSKLFSGQADVMGGR
jgi:cystathionine gamma-synthase